MSSFKVDRISEDIKRELTDILRSLKDPRIQGFLTIIKVDLSNDLSYCKVYVSSYDGFEQSKEAIKGLVSASGYIKRELGLRIKMRKVPQLKFIADDSTQYSANIAEKLRKLTGDTDGEN